MLIKTYNAKENFADNYFIIFWDSLMFYQILPLPLVKRCAIITYEHGIYELPHELPNDLRLRILENYEILGNCVNFIEWEPSAQSSCKNEKKLILARNLQKIAITLFPLCAISNEN